MLADVIAMVADLLEINLEQHFPQTRRSHDRIWQKLVLQQKLLFHSRENSKFT